MRYLWQAKDIKPGIKLLRLSDCHDHHQINEYVLAGIKMDGKPTQYVVLDTQTYATHNSQFRTVEDMAKLLTEQEFLPKCVVQVANDAKSISPTSA